MNSNFLPTTKGIKRITMYDSREIKNALSYLNNTLNEVVNNNVLSAPKANQVKNYAFQLINMLDSRLSPFDIASILNTIDLLVNKVYKLTLSPGEKDTIMFYYGRVGEIITKYVGKDKLNDFILELSDIPTTTSQPEPIKKPSIEIEQLTTAYKPIKNKDDLYVKVAMESNIQPKITAIEGGAAIRGAAKSVSFSNNNRKSMVNNFVGEKRLDKKEFLLNRRLAQFNDISFDD